VLLLTSYKNSVRHLHPIQMSVALVHVQLMVVPIDCAAMSHQVLRYSHLSGDVGCVSTVVIKVTIHVPVT